MKSKDILYVAGAEYFQKDDQGLYSYAPPALEDQTIRKIDLDRRRFTLDACMKNPIIDYIFKAEESCNSIDFSEGFNNFVSEVYPNGYSENGEDGVLLQLFKEIGTTNKACLEIGAGDGVKYSVTADLRFNHDWMGYLIDGFIPVNNLNRVYKFENSAWAELWSNKTPDFKVDENGNVYFIKVLSSKSDETSASASEDDINKALMLNNNKDYSKHSYFIKEIVTAENINKIFYDHNVPEELDLLTIDIDGIDWWIWKAIGPKARVVMVEYNPNIVPLIDATIAYDPSFMITVKDAYRGASIKALYNLGKSMGYSLIHALNCNLIFVKNEELNKIKTEMPWLNNIHMLYAMSTYYFKPYMKSIERHCTILCSKKYKDDNRGWVSSSSVFVGERLNLKYKNGIKFLG